MEFFNFLKGNVIICNSFLNANNLGNLELQDAILEKVYIGGNLAENLSKITLALFYKNGEERRVVIREDFLFEKNERLEDAYNNASKAILRQSFFLSTKFWQNENSNAGVNFDS